MSEVFNKALLNLKNQKAAGIDGIHVEVRKESGERDKKKLFQIIKDIYETEDYVKSLIIPIQKKAVAKKFEEFRNISLLSHASKI